MTGCAGCGVGPDDECSPGCSGPELTPDRLGRISRHVLERLEPELVARVTVEERRSGRVTISTDDVLVELAEIGWARGQLYEATIWSSSGSMLARVHVDAAHWSTAAEAFAAVALRFLY